MFCTLKKDQKMLSNIQTCVFNILQSGQIFPHDRMENKKPVMFAEVPDKTLTWHRVMQ